FDLLPQLPFLWFALKTGFFIMIFILMRASLRRPRYDQMMAFGSKVCLPLTLINLLVTGAIVLAAARGDSHDQIDSSCTTWLLCPASQSGDALRPCVPQTGHPSVSGGARLPAAALPWPYRADPRP